MTLKFYHKSFFACLILSFFDGCKSVINFCKCSLSHYKISILNFRRENFDYERRRVNLFYLFRFCSQKFYVQILKCKISIVSFKSCIYFELKIFEKIKKYLLHQFEWQNHVVIISVRNVLCV